MNTGYKIYETRKRLISRFVFSLEAELETEHGSELYDDEFLIRMGKEEARISRSVDKSTGLMIVIDLAVLLILSGQAAKIKIFGNTIGEFPGVVEIGLFFAALIYHYSAVHFITAETYKEIIRAVLNKKNPDNRTEFFMGSLMPFAYVWEIVQPARYGFQSGKWQIGLSIIQFTMTLSILMGFYLLHAIVLYLGCSHVLQLEAFGGFSSKLVVGAVLLINLSGLSAFLTAYLYPFKFQAVLGEQGQPDAVTKEP